MRLLSLRSVLRLVALVLVAGVLMPAAARAEEQPAILKAYGLDWIERVRDDAWPQPKTERPVICLLDTGVDVTPDTPANDPNGPIVDRLALDGGTGVSQGTGYPYDHGTQMAAIIAAPRNDWGTVGVFPQGRIVSIRVTDGKDTYITPEAVRQGARRCVQWGLAASTRVAAIVMAESNYEQRVSDIAKWSEADAFARNVGAVLVAAVGNDAAAAQVAPLAVPYVVGVAAGDGAGNPCSFVEDLPQPGSLRGPGCSSGRDWPPGSSAAAAAVGALVEALASRRPGLSADELAVMLRSSASSEAGVSVLRAGSLAPGFPLNEPFQSPVSATPAPTPPSRQPVTLLFRPQLDARWRAPRLMVRRNDHQRRGTLVIQVTREGKVVGTWRSLHGRLSLRLARRPGTLTAWVESSGPGKWRSLTTRVRARA